MKPQKSFALRGDILYSESPQRIRSAPGSYLVCEEGRVAGVFSQLPERYAGLPVEDFGGRLIIPGLADLHLHAPQYAFRGLGMDLELLDWLDTHTFPEESKYADLEYADRAYTMFADALHRSATTRACVFATIHLPATKLLMEKLEAAGVRAMVGKVNMDRNSPDSLREENAARSLADTERWLEECGGFERVSPILTPRFIPSCTDELMRGLADIQRRTGLPVQSHLSENLSEIAWVKELCPESAGYADAYARFGLLGGEGCPTVMAHCVHLTDEEMELLAGRGVWVAHCPQSNTNLSSGVAPVRVFLDRGVRAGLGSDIAGGHCLSILRAMADAVQVSKLRWRLLDDSLRPLTVPEAFYLGTAGGGSFFGKVGSFEEGYAFDAVVLDEGEPPPPQPLEPQERLERLLYLTSDDRCVAAKYVEGEKLF